MKKIFVVFAILYAMLSHNALGQITKLLYEGPPVFHGAAITGNYPNTDFLFTVPATGQRPIIFSAQGLPAGLTIESSSGIIRGVVKQEGTYTVKISASNARGESTEELKIVIGDKLCLTPPMGWNSWNVFTNTLDEKLVVEIADAMVSTGMRDLGYQYINMDDYWHAPSRDSSGKPLPDPAKFPHGIKWLSDYVHSKGLKLGIYSDAGTKTCGKCYGSYGYEEIDAKTYAEWGIDLLKYDFCYVPWKKKEAIARYTAMGRALRHSGRSVVYSMCNWGLFKPWKWGERVGGAYWRTTPDIIDTWNGGPFWYGSLMSILKKQTRLYPYAGPGHWNDPDMMIVGNYGQGKATGGGGKYKGMSDTEYQTHMTLWCMLSAPLLASCDLRNMNEATKSILMNDTLLAISQDELGKQARLVNKSRGVWTYRKELVNGEVAFAYFNTTRKTKHISNPLAGNTAPLVLAPHQTMVVRVKGKR